jgi:hypothetical protein
MRQSYLEIETRSGTRDAEIKLLIVYSENDIQVIWDFHRDMQTLYIPNAVADHELSS